MTSTPPTQERTALTAEPALAGALSTVRRNIAAFGDLYPDDTTRDDRYPLRPAEGVFPEGGNRGWAAGFRPGVEGPRGGPPGDGAVRGGAAPHAADFERRVRGGEDLDTHDLGFLYTLASVAPWR